MNPNQQQPAVSLNEHVARRLEAEQLAPLQLDVEPAVLDRIRELAEVGGWSEEQALRLALLYGLSALQQDAEPTAEPLDQANDLGARYVSLKYQTYKLRTEAFQEETRLAAVVSQNKTFEELIGRLEERERG